MTTASAIGSWPGTDVREVIRLVRDTLGSLGGRGDGPDVRGLPFLPELPGRGPGSDLVGRGAGMLVDLPVDLQPSGWRLADRPGRDAARTTSLLGEDLDELAEAYDGWTGRLKLQVAGPWTLAAGIWLPRGDRLLVDEGATRELVDSLAEGVRLHLAQARRLVPGAELVLQVDEPSLPAVLEGRLPTASGYGRIRSIDPEDALTGLRTVLAAADEGETVVHCCADAVPLPLLRRTGAAVSLDTTLLTPRGWEGVAVAHEDGVGLYAGCVPTVERRPDPKQLAASVVDPWHRLGLPAADLDAVTLTPTCGLAGLTPPAALAVLRATIDVATELTGRALED